MMLIGIIWAVAAPLLLLPIGAILVLLLNFTGWSRYRRITVVSGIVVVTVGSIWWADYREFTKVCERVGKPQIFARAKTDGIYLDSPTANSFGMNYLNQQGFAWMEMRSIYDHNKIERVVREANGQTRTEQTDAITARYVVRETFEQPYPHTSMNITRVTDRQTGMVMAQAGSANFDGGWTKWVLGVYGSRHYPDAMTSRDDFQTYYYLAQRTLR